MVDKKQFIQRTVAPFEDRRNLDFPEFVKLFTAGITRMHQYNYAYKEEDFTEKAHKFLRENKVENTEYLVNLDDLPKTYKLLSMDTPIYQENFLRTLGENKDTDADPLNRKILEKQIARYTNVGMSAEEWWKKYDADDEITYELNSCGLRTKLEFDDLEPDKFIPVFGCSHTQGLGTQEKHLWYNHLNEKLPIFNCALSSSGIMESFLLLQQLYEQKPFKKAYVCVPHSERIAHVSKRRIIEGGVHYQQNFLKETELINDIVNAETRNLYTDITKTALISFCKANKIELKYYIRNSVSSIKDFVEWDIIAPPMAYIYLGIYKDLQIVNPKKHTFEQIKDSTARDMVHYGRNWQRCIAKYMLTEA